jgi:hypothetical protein
MITKNEKEPEPKAQEPVAQQEPNPQDPINNSD